jgi:hypothetical protein
MEGVLLQLRLLGIPILAQFGGRRGVVSMTVDDHSDPFTLHGIPRPGIGLRVTLRIFLLLSHQAVRVGYWLISRSGVKITSPRSIA